MNTKNIQMFWGEGEEIEEGVRLMMVIRIWELTEKICFRDRSNWGKDKITHDTLSWFLEGLSHLTCQELSFLYSLLSPIRKTCPISVLDTRTIALLSRLSDINTEKLSNTSEFRNFSSVAQFIFTLCSGGYQLKYWYKNGQLVPSHEFGGMGM